MIRRLFIALCVTLPMLISFGTPATAGWSNDRSGSYSRYHEHHNSCGGVYAARYKHKRPHYYTVRVKPGRYVWQKRRVRVGTIRRRGRC